MELFLDEGTRGMYEFAFQLPMGHADYSMLCRGFFDTLLRGTEWAATGEVTVEWSEDFPTEDKLSPVKAAKADQ